MPFLLTAWVIGWIVRVSVFFFIELNWSWFDSSPSAEKFFQAVSFILTIDLHYSWLPKSAGDLHNFKYPEFVIVLPYVVVSLVTLLHGMIAIFIFKYMQRLWKSKRTKKTIPFEAKAPHLRKE